jgi:hypothetical protein
MEARSGVQEGSTAQFGMPISQSLKIESVKQTKFHQSKRKMIQILSHQGSFIFSVGVILHNGNA